MNKKITKAIFMISILLYSFNNTTGSIHDPPQMNASPPNFVSYSEGSTGNTLTWVFEAEESNDDPANYTVKIDDIGWLGHVNQIWADNVPIVVNIDGLLPGTHNVEIEVWDSGTQQGFAAATFDTLIVEVVGFAINDAKIGFLAPLTGPSFLTEIGESVKNASLLALNDLNTKYPTIGFSLNIQDTGSNTVVAQTASNALVSSGVHGVVGPALSSNLLQVAQTFIDNQIPLISYSATSPDISGLNDSGLIFRTSPNDAIQGSILAEIAKIAGSMNVSTIATNDSFGIGIIDRFTANFTGSTQLSMVYNSGSTNFQTLVASILGGNPDTIVLVADLTHGAAILNELSNQNFTGLILASEGMQNLFITDHLLVGPEILDGILGPTLAINPESTFNIRFNATYGIEAHFFASFAYDAVMMMGDAIAHFNTLDGLQIANSLREVGNNAIGASGLITFDDNGDNIHVAYDILQYQIIPIENRHDFVGVWEPISMSVSYFANVQKTKWPGLIQGTNTTTVVTSTAPVTSTPPISSTVTTSSTSTSSMETSTSTPSTDDDTTTSVETTTIDDTTSTSGAPSLPGFTLALSIMSFSTAFVILRRKNIR